MADARKDKAAELAKLQTEMQRLKASLPEHCHGREGYISYHHARPEQLQRIEDLEDRIKALRAELGS